MRHLEVVLTYSTDKFGDKNIYINNIVDTNISQLDKINDNTFIFNIVSGTRGFQKPESLTSSQLVLCTNKKKIKLINGSINA